MLRTSLPIQLNPWCRLSAMRWPFGQAWSWSFSNICNESSLATPSWSTHPFHSVPFHSIPSTCSKPWLSCDVVLQNPCPCQSRTSCTQLDCRTASDCNPDGFYSRQDSGGSSWWKVSFAALSTFQAFIDLIRRKRGENKREREGQRDRGTEGQRQSERRLQGADKMNWGRMQFLRLTRTRLHNVYFSILSYDIGVCLLHHLCERHLGKIHALLCRQVGEPPLDRTAHSGKAVHWQRDISNTASHYCNTLIL